MRRIVLALMVLSLAPSPRADEWTGADTVFEAGVLLTTAADWYQTAAPSIAGNCSEGNPFLGRCPSQARIAAWFLGGMAVHVAVAALLPQPARRIWQVMGIVGEGTIVAWNAARNVSPHPVGIVPVGGIALHF